MPQLVIEIAGRLLRVASEAVPIRVAVGILHSIILLFIAILARATRVKAILSADRDATISNFFVAY